MSETKDLLVAMIECDKKTELGDPYCMDRMRLGECANCLASNASPGELTRAIDLYEKITDNHGDILPGNITAVDVAQFIAAARHA